MNRLLSRLFGVLKYILLIAAFGVTFFGMIMTYKRLEKNLVDAIPTLLPFAVLLIVYLVNLFIKNPVIKDNLLYNFTSVMVLSVIIIIGIRAKFDTNMLLYYKYKIDYNPLFLSDNLSSIKLMLYVLSAANVLFMVSTIFEKKKKKVVTTEENALKVEN